MTKTKPDKKKFIWKEGDIVITRQPPKPKENEKPDPKPPQPKEKDKPDK